MCFGSHILKSWSRQQKTISLSSAEAELHAAVAASSEVLGILALLRDMGVQAQGEINVDSSAALGIVQRAGCGRVRHLHLQALWVQECRSTGRLSYKKVLGTANPSDVLTKHVPGDLLDTHLKTLNLEVRDGRAETAPTLASLELVRVSNGCKPKVDKQSEPEGEFVGQAKKDKEMMEVTADEDIWKRMIIRGKWADIEGDDDCNLLEQAGFDKEIGVLVSESRRPVRAVSGPHEPPGSHRLGRLRAQGEREHVRPDGRGGA